jgi:dihydroorotase
MPGVQTLVPVMLNHVHEGRLTLERFVDLTAHGPQCIFNIAGKGRLAVGYDADFTLVDLQETRTITDDWVVSKCGWTPFNGMDVTGWPKATIIRGATVMRDDEVQDAPAGVPVRFQETLNAS